MRTLAEAPALLAVEKLMVLVLSFITSAVKTGGTSTPKPAAVFLVMSV